MGKKFKIISMLLFLAAIASGCKSEESKIKDIAEGFLTAYYVDYDYKKAEQLATAASKVTIGNKEEATKTNLYAKEEKADILVQNVDIKSENYAVVNYIANEMERTLVLLRNRNTNEWEVDTFESEIDGSNLPPNARGGFTFKQSKNGRSIN